MVEDCRARDSVNANFLFIQTIQKTAQEGNTGGYAMPIITWSNMTLDEAKSPGSRTVMWPHMPTATAVATPVIYRCSGLSDTS